MKKFVAITLMLVMCMGALSACGSAIEQEGENDMSMFVRVERVNCWQVVYHRETKVMYAVSIGGYNSGNFTLLVNTDGTPMLWRE